MKATEARFLDFIKKSPQFTIPIYQRTYSWTDKECRQLWEDIVRTGENEQTSAHFVGSIVYIEKGLYRVTGQEPLLVIDGQQRLTTLSLIIAALAEKLSSCLVDAQEPFDGFSPRKLKNYYLINPEEVGERYYKLILSQTDKESLINIIDGNQQPEDASLLIYENFKLFQKWLDEYSGDLSDICKGVAKLMIVDISLSRDQDNPQLIFESMNSTGLELTQADLIRNFILMGLETEQQNHIYKEYWRPIEKEFGQKSYGTHFDNFMRHYLTICLGEIPKIDKVYESFKKHSFSSEVKDDGIEPLVSDIKNFARYFCAMALGKEESQDLKWAFHDLREYEVDVVYPFLLELYNDYKNDMLTEVEFLSIIRLVEAYVFRRNVCGIPTNSLNTTFANFTKNIDKGNYLESIKAHFLLLRSYRRFPSDDEFKRELCGRDLYKFRRRSYWLRKMENHERKERVNVEEYTIEHILPQNQNLSVAWKGSLGPEWGRIHDTWLHTLGNLTLTGYNSEYSDRPFEEKRDMKGGFRESPIKLNQGLGQLQAWNEDAIKARAERLSNIAVAVWAVPVLDDETLEKYRPRIQSKTGYSIEDHPQLLNEDNLILFEKLRKEVLALDPVVVEEFLKSYVAYKAETNFVDVVPRADRLRLSLNMPFLDINDPKGICNDVTGQRRRGNGDVHVSLYNSDELPYIMGLVRQSLERQLGNGDER